MSTGELKAALDIAEARAAYWKAKCEHLEAEEWDDRPNAIVDPDWLDEAERTMADAEARLAALGAQP